ncbi:MAG: ECF-type sigma factor [Verrucomicrobiales bacterium]|nr:ECF-type sigma factor [Verrucomicrobiales bacterium]
MSEVTRILEAIQQGNSKASEELFPLVYDELRQVATQMMRRERPEQTLQPTALVHEAWLRLVGPDPHFWNSRSQAEIARVLDGGATETGRPYFVMELVQQIPVGN